MGEKVSVNKNAECQAGLGRRPQSAGPANYFAVSFFASHTWLFFCQLCVHRYCAVRLTGRVRDPFKVHHPSGFVSHRQLYWELAVLYHPTQIISTQLPD